MKTLALSNGDLVLGPSFQTITGTQKIRQDLALALGEEYGTDRFHPDFGSILIQYIGSNITDDTELLVETEVSRVVAQYIAAQQSGILDDHNAFRRSRFDPSDVVVGISKVSAEISDDSDNIRVTVFLTTYTGDTINISRTITQ